MPIENIAAFWAVSILFVITPGADWAYAITVGLRHRTVVPATSGMLCGHLAATVFVAAGVGAAVSKTPIALAFLTGLGSGYLIWLGISTLRRPSLPMAGVDSPEASKYRQAIRGFGVSGLNPKVFLLFLALLPQFTRANANWPLTVQIVVLGIVHTASCAIVYFSVAMSARRILRARPTAALTVTRIAGAAMIVIGFLLMGEQIYHRL